MKFGQLVSTLLFILSFSFPVYSSEKAIETSESRPEYAGIEITVNINSADAEELATLLSGVGSKKAQKIIDYRQQNGPFKSVEELGNVSGIGPAIIEKNRSRIIL